MHVRDQIKWLLGLAEKGDQAETPAVLLGQVALFLVPLVSFMLAVCFLLYWQLGGTLTT